MRTFKYDIIWSFGQPAVITNIRPKLRKNADKEKSTAEIQNDESQYNETKKC
jgi:hypothetical protein